MQGKMETEWERKTEVEINVFNQHSVMNLKEGK